MLTVSGADVNRPCCGNELPLRVAVRRGRVDLCRELIARGATVDDVDCAGWTLLHEASNIGRLDMVELLLQTSAAKFVNIPAIGGDTACHLAARCGYGPVVRILVDAGANLKMKSGRGRNVRQEAAAYGHESTVRQIESLHHS